ncbi:MAG: efflux RND transporter periplasmic adaptor subunit [Acidobacteria bacterium]|nr:MAG: efflux RND transporter periplasmic adaptor subunit [Acidobacteriota bacterium]
MNANRTHRLPRPALRALPAVLALAALALAACGGGDDHAPAARDERAPRAVRLATARLEPLADRLVVTASVEPIRRVMPGTKILGRVDAVPVHEGQRVARGQLLAKLENRDLEAAVAQAEAALVMAEAQLENVRAQHDRIVRLHERGSATDKDLEDVQAAFRTAKAAVRQAEANLQAAKVTAGYAKIVSPVAGWVVDKRVEPGDMATPGMPLFTVEDVSKVKIVARVPENDIVGLAPGHPVHVRIDVLDLSTEAAITRLVPSGDRMSRTFDVEIVLDNPDGRIKSGMFARAEFERGARDGIAVPRGALVERGQLVGLYVVGDDGRARLRWVRVGKPVGDERVEVLSGLAEGERYVAEVPPGLTDGDPVTEG